MPFFALKLRVDPHHHRAHMIQAEHLRTIMEEEEIKAMKHQKKKGEEKEFEKALESADALQYLTYHKTEPETLLAELETSKEGGLTERKVEEKLAKFGPNKLKEKTVLPWYVKLLGEMFGLFSNILWVGAILSFIGYGLTPSDPSNVRFFEVQPSNSCTWR